MLGVCPGRPPRVDSHRQLQTPSTGSRHPSFLGASLSDGGTFPPTDEGCRKPVLGACLGPRMTQRLYDDDDDDVMLNVLRCQLIY